MLLVGVLTILAQVRAVWPPSFAWTFYLLLPGLVCWLAARRPGRASLWLRVVGATLLSAGALLLVLGLTDAWTALAYAWPLVLPGGAGLALWRAPQRTYSVYGQRMVAASLGLSALWALAAVVLGSLAGAGAAVVPAVALLLIGLGGTLLARDGAPWP